tara:strand:- start:418 stop:1320 length:903 start_codon:yes stop_codon:yes gene_type:complete
MIEIHGPTYKYTGEILDKPEIIVVRDHHYSEEDHCFHIQKLLENSTCDPHLHTLLFDHVLIHDDVLKDYNIILYPTFIAKEGHDFNQQLIKVDWNKRQCTFNFMINKPRKHREILLQLIKRFNLINYTHSLPWKHNDVNSIPVTDYKFGPEVVMDKGIKNGSFKNAETYDKLLKTTVFEPSCISLITEPVFIERESILTEKTIMSIYSGTLPIWVGGWRCADALAQFGFDTFDDIIDHSYQCLADPYDRCYKAIELNLKLLKDFEKCKTIIEHNQLRFQHNLALVQSNVFQKNCDKIDVL